MMIMKRVALILEISFNSVHFQPQFLNVTTDNRLSIVQTSLAYNFFKSIETTKELKKSGKVVLKKKI